MIIHKGTALYIENGFTATTNMQICKALDISPGQLTFHFPTKEHLLVELIERLCSFQWDVMEHNTDKGENPLLCYCLELTAMAAMCEDNPNAKDLYLAAYTHSMSLEIIRSWDIKKTMRIFSKYRSTWAEADFFKAEMLISGIEFSTLITDCTEDLTLHDKISCALDSILMIYGVPEKERAETISAALSMDYHEIGNSVLKQFIEHLKAETESALAQAQQ